MRHLILLFSVAVFPAFGFSQLTSIQRTFAIESHEFQTDSVPVFQSMLTVHVQPDVPEDMSSLSLNVYVDDLPVMEEIQLTPAQLILLQSSELAIPLVVYDPQLAYRITISSQNIAGEYLPAFTSYYPNN